MYPAIKASLYQKEWAKKRRTLVELHRKKAGSKIADAVWAIRAQRKGKVTVIF